MAQVQGGTGRGAIGWLTLDCRLVNRGLWAVGWLTGAMAAGPRSLGGGWHTGAAAAAPRALVGGWHTGGRRQSAGSLGAMASGPRALVGGWRASDDSQPALPGCTKS